MNDDGPPTQPSSQPPPPQPAPPPPAPPPPNTNSPPSPATPPPSATKVDLPIRNSDEDIEQMEIAFNGNQKNILQDSPCNDDGNIPTSDSDSQISWSRLLPNSDGPQVKRKITRAKDSKTYKQMDLQTHITTDRDRRMITGKRRKAGDC